MQDIKQETKVYSIFFKEFFTLSYEKTWIRKYQQVLQHFSTNFIDDDFLPFLTKEQGQPPR